MVKTRNGRSPPAGALARAEQAFADGDTRGGRALLRQALAQDPSVDRAAAEALLARTRTDPGALAVAAALLLVLALAAWFGLLHPAV